MSGEVIATRPPVEYVEDRVPLEGIEERAGDIITTLGGTIDSSHDRRIDFTLPLRQGVAASGALHGTLLWEAGSEDEGIVTIRADDEVEEKSASRIALLVAGTFGALLWILWPFFPALGPASWVGAALAFAAWFLAVRRSRGGIIMNLLRTIVEAQRRSVME